MNINKKITQISLFLILTFSLSAQNDTLIVNTYDYTIRDRGTSKALYLKNKPDSILNGQHKVMKTNSWHEDMFVKNNMLHGKNFIYYSKECTEERNYNNGLLHGKQYIYHSNMKNIYVEDTYTNGIQIDTSYRYFEDGSLNSVTPNGRNGKKNGKYYSYYPNKQIQLTGTYKEGNSIGTWFEYYNTGNLAKLEKFDKDGFSTYHQTFYPNGQKDIKKSLKKGVYIGKYERFYENGKRVFLYNFKNGYQRGKQIYINRQDDAWNEYSINNKGQLHGKYTLRNCETNIPQVKGKFKNGIKDSKWEYFTADGKLFRRESYKDGKRISIINTPHLYNDGNGNRITYDENFSYTIPSENPYPDEKQKVEEIPFFLFGE